MTRRSAPIALAGIAAALAALAFGCGKDGGPKGPEELVIGEYGSLTGNDANFGQSTKDGVQLALDELVASSGGKIGGMTVRVVVEDDQGKPEEAATVVQKLLNQDRVIAVLGEVASSRSLAAAPYCQRAGVPMISPSSTNPGVTQVGDYIFRMCFLDDFQGRVIARFAYENLGARKAAVLKDVKNDYSVGLAEFFTQEFTRLGGTIAVEQAYSSGDQDFRAQLTAIKAQNPEVIVVPGYYTEGGLIARQARELGVVQPLLGGDGWESQQLIEIGGEALDGCYYSNHWSLDAPDPVLQGFVEKARQKLGKDPDAIGGLAYDAAKVLFQALERMAAEDPQVFAALGSSKAGTPARAAATAQLRDRIAATSGFPGVTGSISLDANRNATKPAVVIGIEKGRKVYKATIAP
jgi:branched-chain amino acid transport system substrate-binding protein